MTNLTELCKSFDAVVATHYSSAFWFLSIRGINIHQALGYYIQDFEPMMYAEGTYEQAEALASYSLVPGLIRFSKTEWTRKTVMDRLGVDVTAIGVDFDLDLFRPRPRPALLPDGRPLRIAAMIRPEFTYRQPEMTMQLLKLAHKNFGDRVETVIFGTEADNPKFLKLTRDFPWKLYGSLPSRKVASLLNTADIFVDCSSHQAMGLTALEAMATGCAVIVPQAGGVTSFVRHMENGLISDTSSLDLAFQSLTQLIVDADLRQRIQRQGIFDACRFFPERAALNMLRCLFGSGE